MGQLRFTSDCKECLQCCTSAWSGAHLYAIWAVSTDAEVTLQRPCSSLYGKKTKLDVRHCYQVPFPTWPCVESMLNSLALFAAKLKKMTASTSRILWRCTVKQCYMQNLSLQKKVWWRPLVSKSLAKGRLAGVSTRLLFMYDQLQALLMFPEENNRAAFAVGFLWHAI